MSLVFATNSLSLEAKKPKTTSFTSFRAATQLRDESQPESKPQKKLRMSIPANLSPVSAQPCADVPTGDSNIVRIEQWAVFNFPEEMYLDPDKRHIRLHGAVYGHPRYPDGKVIDTSVIIGSTGTIVHCESRSYQLGEPSPTFLAWLAETGKVLDPVQPVKVNC